MRHNRTAWGLGFAACLVLAGVVLWLRPPTVRISDRYSVQERQEIVAAARRCALKNLARPVLQGGFSDLWSWVSRNPLQTFYVVRDDGQGQLLLICGNPNPNTPLGYDLWSQTVLKRKGGHWVTDEQ